MKTLLLVIFSAITLTAQAQTSVYHPFPDSNAVWNVQFNYGDGISCSDEIHYSYIFGSDTSIGAFTYHKIIIPSEVNVGKYPCSYVVLGYQGAIRQDTIGKRVYFVERDSITEKLLYDFNLHVGDTLKYGVSKWAVCSNFTDTVTTIDSILIGNTYRKKFWFNGPFSNYQLIEGIGSTNGLLELPCPNLIEEGLILNCFKQNGKTLYPDTTTSCNIISSVNDLPEKNNSITFFPNPAINHLTITTNSNTPSEIILYDIASRKLMEEKFIKEVSLNIAHLAKGVYLYQVTDERGMIGRGKVVKE